jgi:hypothetical protein
MTRLRGLSEERNTSTLHNVATDDVSQINCTGPAVCSLLICHTQVPGA